MSPRLLTACAKPSRHYADRDFLTQGDVFPNDLIDGYIDLKWEEIYRFELTPHPVEFEMYYSV